MQQAVQPLATSAPFPPRTRPTWTSPPPRGPRRGLVRAWSMRTERSDNLDHLQRGPNVRQQQGGAPRRRVAQTPPFGLWDSFPEARTLQQMVNTMERLMDDPLAYSGAVAVPMPRNDDAAAAAAAASGGGGYRRRRTPWEIKERKGEYLVRFDMPGMTKRDVRVAVQEQERLLVVRAEKEAAEEEGAGGGGNGGEAEEEEGWSPASFGRYRFRIELPENVAVEGIRAEVRDGVLYVTIPKAAVESKVLSIDVQ